jgi:hypothetical protein
MWQHFINYRKISLTSDLIPLLRIKLVGTHQKQKKKYEQQEEEE